MGILPSIVAAKTVFEKEEEERRKKKVEEKPRGLSWGRSNPMALSGEDVDRIASAVVEKAAEDVGIRDIMIGSAMGKGAIPLYGRETRKEPCSCCMIDPKGANAPDNRMCTTKGAIGTLSDSEEREWCSEIKIVSDGRCARARSIREAAKECKERYPQDTAKFFECYAPAFSKITKGGNPKEFLEVRLWTGIRIPVSNRDEAVKVIKRELEGWMQKGDRIIWYNTPKDDELGRKPSYAVVVNEVGEETDASAMITYGLEPAPESNPSSEPVVDNVEVYTSEALPLDVAQVTGLHRDTQVEFRYTTYYYGPDVSLFQRDLQRLLRERTGIPYLAVDAYYIRSSNPMEYVTITDPGKTTFKAGEIVSREAFDKENERVKRLGEKPATGK